MGRPVEIATVVDLAQLRDSNLAAKQGRSPMRCPKCHAHSVVTLNSRGTDGGRTIRRRRACTTCNHRWTTFEVENLPPPQVPQEIVHLFALASEQDKETLLALARHLVKASLP